MVAPVVLTAALSERRRRSRQHEHQTDSHNPQEFDHRTAHFLSPHSLLDLGMLIHEGGSHFRYNLCASIKTRVFIE